MKVDKNKRCLTVDKYYDILNKYRKRFIVLIAIISISPIIAMFFTNAIIYATLIPITISLSLLAIAMLLAIIDIKIIDFINHFNKCEKDGGKHE